MSPSAHEYLQHILDETTYIMTVNAVIKLPLPLADVPGFRGIQVTHSHQQD